VLNLDQLKNIDVFTKNIGIVFIGLSLVNLFNLLYQLIVAHNLSPSDFAAFSSLISIIAILTAPMQALQTVLAKYTSEFKAENQNIKVKFLLSRFFKWILFFSAASYLILFASSQYLKEILKIPAVYSVYVLALAVASFWIMYVFYGGLQGLEVFKWLIAAMVIPCPLKIILAYVFIYLGFSISGALSAFLIATLLGIVIAFFPLKNYIFFKSLQKDINTDIHINFREIVFYLFPVAVSLFCFVGLVNSDMILVKYFFNSENAALYSLAQMAGKIFLFLPFAVSLVMIPRASGLKARNMDTVSTLKRALLFGSLLSIIAILGYNLFPAFTLKVLTGKTFSESIFLGRLFSISMSFFALLYILINYFLSIKDTRFIKYLVFFMLLQILAIIKFHDNLMQVQIILCINSILLFLVHLYLIF
jgi:O-antigen/teichoic acid export membrane protein